MNDQDGTNRATMTSEKRTEAAVVADGCFLGVEEIRGVAVTY